MRCKARASKLRDKSISTEKRKKGNALSLLTQIIRENVQRYDEYAIVFFEGQAHTNRQELQRIMKYARGLRELGLNRGDVLLVFMENSLEVPRLYAACLFAGIVFCPALFLLSAEELSWVAEHSEAAFLVTDPGLLPKVREACRGLWEGGRVIVAHESVEKTVGAVSLRELAEEQPAELPDTDPADDDVAALLYTSGTTGKPKGVLLSHRNLGSNVVSAIRTGKVGREETALSSLPLSHSFGITVSLMPWFAGLKAVLTRWFEPGETLMLTESHHVRSMVGVPEMFVQLLNHPHADRYNTRSWKRLVSGAAPCPVEIQRAFHEKFGVNLYEGYGLTEASPIVSMQGPHIPFKYGSVGLPLEGVEVRVVDDFDRPLPPGSPGEIVVRGPNVMLGYLKDPQGTEEALRGGWLHTGDMGYLDEDGYLYVVERKRDLIITSGFNLYPAEVEEVLQGHPAVEEAVVVGKPDPVKGEVVHAFIKLKEGRVASRDELLEHCRRHLVYYKCPKDLTFTDSIPKNLVGKPLRRALRESLLREGT